MARAVAAISALLFATAILLTGNGLQGTLLAIRANIEGFPSSLIGVLMAAYFAGFILGCRYIPGVIKSVGHIRTFVALASIASASTLLHPLFVDWVAWALLRGITGCCMAGLIMIIESWLNERATNEDRGRILSVYRMVDLSATMIGNALIASANPAGFQLFALTSILISLALVPIALTRSEAPRPIASAKLDIRGVFALSPVAAIAAPSVGLANGAFWAVGPVFAQKLGYSADIVAVFMTIAIFGAAVSQWPLGWLSDSIDRRIVITGAAIGAVVGGLGLATFAAKSETNLLGFGVVYGAFAMSVFGLTAAHANDHAKPGTSVATNGSVLMLNGCGSVIGAVAGGVVMSEFGAPAVFYYTSSVYALLALFCAIRIISSRALTSEEKSTFSPVPRNASQGVFEISEDTSDLEPAGRE